jgi:hypothetical protein
MFYIKYEYLQGYSLDILNQPKPEEDGRGMCHLAHLTIAHSRFCKDANHQITHHTNLKSWSSSFIHIIS